MNRAGNMMYLRTGNLFKDFTVEKKDEDTTARGRLKTEYDTNSTTTIRSRYFYIQGIHEPGSLGIWTIYYAQERSDTHAD